MFYNTFVISEAVMEIIFAVCVNTFVGVLFVSVYKTKKKTVCDNSPLISSVVGGRAEKLTHQSAVLMLMKKKLKWKMDKLCTTTITCAAAP